MSKEKPVNIQQKEICISVSYFRFCLTRKIVAFILGCLSLIDTVYMPSPHKKKKKKNRPETLGGRIATRAIKVQYRAL